MMQKIIKLKFIKFEIFLKRIFFNNINDSRDLLGYLYLKKILPFINLKLKEKFCLSKIITLINLKDE